MDVWAVGAAYEPYVGRWSRLVAPELLAWLNVPGGARWLDVGCGTGALSQAILETASPASVVGIDASAGFLAYAQQQVQAPNVRFEVADAQDLPFEANAFDAVVSGLMLNFIPDPQRALTEMARVARPGGTMGIYAWDYAEGMQLMRYFWDAAVALDPAAADQDEGRRFPICHPDALSRGFTEAGLQGVAVRPIDVPTHFRDFDDFWQPFLGGQGPAPNYLMALPVEQRDALREDLRKRLPTAADGSIALTARAWAARGTARAWAARGTAP